MNKQERIYPILPASLNKEAEDGNDDNEILNIITFAQDALAAEETKPMYDAARTADGKVEAAWSLFNHNEEIVTIELGKDFDSFTEAELYSDLMWDQIKDETWWKTLPDGIHLELIPAYKIPAVIQDQMDFYDAHPELMVKRDRGAWRLAKLSE